MTEDRKPRPNLNNGLGGFPPGYKRVEIYPEKTFCGLTETNVAHLEKFKEFLQDKVIKEVSHVCLDLDVDPDQAKIVRDCRDYITHIDALLGDK